MFGLLNTGSGSAKTHLMPDAARGGPRSNGFDEDRLSGFVAGTRIATQLGWRPVEALTVGDVVMTFDHGAREIMAVTRGTTFVSADVRPELACPVSVPAEAIGNEEPLILMPEQTVMIESDIAEAATGDPFALIPARLLVGYRGIERTLALRPVEVVTLHFEADEIVYAEGGTLVLAPAAIPGEANVDFLSQNYMPAPYTVYGSNEARALVDAMAQEDARAYGAAAYAAAA